jgi:hypothetical protein
MISYGNLVFKAFPMIGSTFMTTRRSRRGSPGYIKITVFRDMTQCVSLDGVALAHQIHATLNDSDDPVFK